MLTPGKIVENSHITKTVSDKKHFGFTEAKQIMKSRPDPELVGDNAGRIINRMITEV